MGTKDHRKYRRTRITFEVELMHPMCGNLLLKTRDISDGGIFLIAESDILLEVGHIVEVQVKGMNQQAPIVKMEVVRVEDEGMGLRFV